MAAKGFKRLVVRCCVCKGRTYLGANTGFTGKHYCNDCWTKGINRRIKKVLE